MPITNTEIKFIDFTKGYYLYELESKSKVTPYDVLEVEIKDNISQFYSNVQLNEQIVGLTQVSDKYKQKFEKEKGEAMQNTINASLKELNNNIIRGDPPFTVMNSINSIIDKRVSSLQRLVETNCLQLNQYMILWDYQSKGYSRYIYIAEGESCDICDSLNGKTFNIEDAEVGVNLQPMHPNCDCMTGILDNDGNIAALLKKDNENKIADKKNNKFLDYLQTALDIAGLIPGFGELADGTNAAIYTLRGDYLNAGLSAAAMIPFAGWLSTGGKLTGKAINAVDTAGDVGKITKKATKEAIEGAGKANPNGIKINVGKQDKHIPGTNNYKQSIASGANRSILAENPQQLLDDFAGTGQKIGVNKERVDFGKVIGQYYDESTGTFVDTTRGIIHYDSKGGAHIVPSAPR